MMLDFNLEFLRAFYYVAELNSITKAADALFLSQPAITRSINKLEKHLGCRLFSRISRGVELTKEGEILFFHVSKAFEEMISGEKKLYQMVTYGADSIKVGATETALYYFLLSEIKAFKERYPSISFHLTGSSSPEISSLLTNGSVDLAVGVSPMPETAGLSMIKVTAFRDFHDIFVAGSAFENLRNKQLSVEELSKLPIVAVEKGTSARSQIEKWFAEHGILFAPEYSVRTSTTVIPFVENNLAVGIVPSMFAKESIEQGKIFQLSTEKAIPSRYIIIMHRNDFQMSAPCKYFIEQLSTIKENKGQTE